MTGRVERMSGSLAGTPGNDREELEPSTAGPALRLLLVEDDAHDAYAVRRALRKSKPAFEIIHCTGAEDALERVASEAAAFDVGLIDYGLPGMSGMELCNELLGAEVPFPLVMLTGTGTERLAVEALRSGVFDYVVKDPNAGYLALLPSTLAKAVHRHTDRVERRRAEEALRESEERLRRSVLDAPIPIMMHAEGGEVLMISKKWTELSGYSHADIPNILDWTEKAYGADREHMKDLIGGLYEIEEPFEDEAYVTTASGERRTWDFRTAPLGQLPDGRRFVISMAVDITERTRTEEALRQSEERYARAVCGTNDGLWDRNLQTNEDYFSPRWEEIVGYEPGELEPVIQTFVDLLHPDDREPMFEAVRAHLEERTAYDIEIRLRHKSGEYVWVRSRGQAVWDDDGEPSRMAGSITDITERKSAEAERERLEAQLRQSQKMEAVGTLAGGIAHDFNNILAGMTGYAHLAIDAVPAKSQAHGDLEQILKSIDRAASLVRQILTFSRRSEAECHPVEIGRVVEEALQLLRASIPATIEIRRKIDREAGTVMADATQLQRVVMNLCTNAADAIGPGPGTIEVGLAGVESGAADTATRPDLAPGSYVKLSVSDSGVGMDAATQARVFEPFFTTKEPGKGTGLGLAVAHGIVRKHGGTIEVDSEPGRGTTMTVLLPCAEVVERDVARADRDIPRGRERILLIDDEAAIARSEARLLERLGYRVEATTSSVRALEAFRAAPEAFDLVITDHAMPELPGMALAREILKARGDIPIILRSGYADALGTEDAMAAGIREFMLKPIHPDDLARAVRRALDGDAKGGDEGHGTGSGNR